MRALRSQLPRLEVDGQHLARPQAASLEHVLGGQPGGSGLGGEDHEPRPGAREPRRAQAVAVDRGPDHAAVAEGHESGAVPGFEHAAVVVVKVDDRGVLAAVGAVLVGLRHAHHDGLERAPPRAHEKLQELVEGARVAAVRVHGGEQVADTLSPQGVGQVRLAGGHPLEVALKGVDLAVVGQHAHGLRQAPLGGGVRAEPPVEDRERGGVRGVAQIGVEPGQHGRRDHAFVDDGARRERAHVEIVQAPDGLLGGERLADLAARQKQRPLEVVAAQRRACDDLLDARCGRLLALPECALVHGHRAPSGDRHPLVAQRLFHEIAAESPPPRVGGQKDHADRHTDRGRVRRDARPRRAVLVQPRPEHVPGDGGQQTGAVAGLTARPEAAAVLESRQGGQSQLHDVASRRPVDRRHEADAAGGMLRVQERSTW